MIDASFLYEMGIVDPGSNSDEAYREWIESLEGTGQPARAVPGGYGIKIWIVLRIPSTNFSDHLEYDEELSMYLPSKGYGELWGIATNQAQVDMLTSTREKKSDVGYVFLVYKIRVKEEEEWRALLGFLGRRQMIEQEHQ